MTEKNLDSIKEALERVRELGKEAPNVMEFMTSKDGMFNLVTEKLIRAAHDADAPLGRAAIAMVAPMPVFRMIQLSEKLVEMTPPGVEKIDLAELFGVIFILGLYAVHYDGDVKELVEEFLPDFKEKCKTAHKAAKYVVEGEK